MSTERHSFQEIKQKIERRTHGWSYYLAWGCSSPPPQFFKFSLDSNWNSVDASQASAKSPPVFSTSPLRFLRLTSPMAALECQLHHHWTMKNSENWKLIVNGAYRDSNSELFLSSKALYRLVHSGRDTCYMSCSVFIFALRSLYSALNVIPLH